MELLISLISGAIGGNVAGGLMKNLNQGAIVNSLAGLIGGGLGGQILAMLGMSASGGGMDIGAIVGQVASGGVGGGVVLAIVGVVRNMMAR